MGRPLREELEEGEDAVANPFKVCLLQLLSAPLSPHHTLATALLLALAHHPNVSPQAKSATRLSFITDKADPPSEFLLQIKGMLVESIRDISWEDTKIGALANTVRLL